MVSVELSDGQYEYIVKLIRSDVANRVEDYNRSLGRLSQVEPGNSPALEYWENVRDGYKVGLDRARAALSAMEGA